MLLKKKSDYDKIEYINPDIGGTYYEAYQDNQQG